jgi:hypothetical protein
MCALFSEPTGTWGRVLLQSAMRTSRLAGLVALSLTLAAAPAQAQDEAIAPTPEVTSEPVAPVPQVVVAPTPEVVVDTAETCAEAASSIARGSVVQVVSGDARGSGFLFHDSSHVITSFGIVRDGHGVSVTDADGNTRSARIVNSAQGDDLAMLELGAPLPGAPLPLADEGGLHAGASIVVLSYTGGVRVHGGPSTAGLAGLHGSTGTLSAIGDRAVQLDAPLSTASSGGPVLDCRGNVLAMLSVGFAGWGEPVHLATSRAAIADLESRIDHPEGYDGRVRFFFGLGIAMAYEDPGGPMGGYAELGLSVFDAFVVAGRFHYLMRADTPVGSDALALSNERFRGDAYLGYRQLVTLGSWGMHFEIGLGGSVTSASGNVRRATIDDSVTPPVVVIRDEAIAQRWSVRPMAVVNLELGPFLIGYTLEVDIDRLHVVHLFDLGFRL